MRLASLSAIVLAASVSVTLAADLPTFKLTIDDRGFTPAELHVPTGTKIEVAIHNSRTTKAEFESLELRREKIIPAGGDDTVYIGPLSPGEYTFIDDFMPTARGRVIAR